MENKMKAVIIEPSSIVKQGLMTILKGFNISTADIKSLESLQVQLFRIEPDFLIVNPSYADISVINNLRSKSKNSPFKVIALLTSLTDSSCLRDYDEVISIYDNHELIKDKIHKLSCMDVSDDNVDLTSREKEILISIVSGLTNKEIAENFSLSAYTIMAHRRNITNKLNIHSLSGLTIYAIVNKLVSID